MKWHAIVSASARSGRRVALPARDRAPRQSPRERQQPHRPQLRVHAVAPPRVAAVLVAVAGRADDERRDGRGGRGGPAFPAEQARAEVDRDRPEREQQVQDPQIRGLVARAGDARRVRGERVREALVVVEERRAERRGTGTSRRAARGPRRSARRPSDHLQVEGAVVEVAARASSPPRRTKRPNDARERDERERTPARRASAARDGRRASRATRLTEQEPAGRMRGMRHRASSSVSPTHSPATASATAIATTAERPELLLPRVGREVPPKIQSKQRLEVEVLDVPLRVEVRVRRTRG